MPWRFGDHVLLRTRNRGQLSWVVPATIVEDSPGLIALNVSLGSPAKIKVGLDGTPISRSLPYREAAGMRTAWPRHGRRWPDALAGKEPTVEIDAIGDLADLLNLTAR